MKRTYRVPLFGEIVPESVADTASVVLWAGTATAIAYFYPTLTGRLLKLEPTYLFLLLAFSLTAAFAIVQFPMSYFGLIYRDDPENEEWSP